jgi:CheY-like chemotaxis protein
MPRSATPPLILIADDSRDTREMYVVYLSALGYRVQTAENGREVIAKARARPPDAIVLDLSMPDLDGWATMGELQADPQTAPIPILVLTGHDLKAHLKRAALAVGACSFLTKPCLPEQLEREVAARINTRLNERRWRRAAPAE